MGTPEGEEGARKAQDEAMRARLEKLSSAIESRRGVPSTPVEGGADKSPREDSGSAMAKGLRAASELVAGVLVGGFIGWELDALFGTRPWLSIVFFMLGVVAGFWNVIRMSAAPTSGAGEGRRDDKSGSGS
jgi:ATP synthase protein I